MTTRAAIEAYAAEVARQFKPEKIILFGSYAYGTPTEDSDVDLLVIMPFRGRSTPVVVKIQMAVRAPFPMDMLVRTPKKVEERLALGDCLMQEIMEKGQVLYDSGNGRVGGQGGGRLRRRSADESNAEDSRLGRRRLPLPAVR